MDYNNGSEPVYSAPVYTAPAPEAPKASVPGKTKGIISMVLGIVGLIGCCCWGLGFIPGIVGIILACLSKKEAGKFNGFAIAGLITSILATLGVIYFIMIVIGFAGNGVYSDAFQDAFWETYNSMQGIQ